ncbi:MAG TPA: ABC transporter permease [Longimicrobiales bacterium]|nr:ABC transporter permease [Longimicrobiales bacterium]
MTIPRWMQAVLRWIGPWGRADDAIGDLNEMHVRHLERRGPVLGRVYSWVGTLDMGGALLRQRLRGRDLTYRHEDGSLRPAEPFEPRRWDMGRALRGWRNDLVQAARSLRRAPGFAGVTVLTLALAIGANTAIFSVVKAVLLRPLPFPDADRLVFVGGTAPGSDLPDDLGVPDELYVEYASTVSALEDLALYGTGSSTSRADDHVEQLFVTQATPSFFTTLGARPALGRLPTDEDDGTVVVLSHWLWQEWFGSDPAVLGRSYTFAQQMRTVIGVLPPEFRFPDERTAFWVPLQIRASEVSPGGFGPTLVGRLAPDADLDGLRAQLEPLPARVQERLGGPPSYAQTMERYQPVAKTLHEHMVGAVATPLWIVLGTMGIVFLIACTNVANLFMVRAESRRRDMAVRRALGSSRGGIIRAQMAEALLLAGVGGILGAVIAQVGVPLLVRAAPDAVAGGFRSAPIPGLAEAGLDLTALLFAAGISILAACVFGLLPAIRTSGKGMLGGLREGGRGVVGRGLVARDALIVLQTAAALVLLVGSALLARSFWQLNDVDPGYDTRDIFTFQVAVRRDDITDRASMSRFQYQFMDRIEALPGVESVGFISTLPLDEGAGFAAVTTPDIEASGAEPPRVRNAGAGGAYFQTMGIDLLQGRFFDRLEEEEGAPYVIISQAAAELLFQADDPLDRQIRPADNPNSPWFTVIGVVEDTRIDDFRQPPQPAVYLPAVSGSPAYVVRTPAADRIAPEIRAIVREMIPESPMYRVFTMETLAANTMGSLSFTMLMLGIAAGLATVLGAVGIYGVLSYLVTQRKREIAVRMALGAEQGGLRRMFVWQGGRVAIIGIALGILIALGLTRFLGTLLFGVEPLDASTFALMSGTMLAVALLASYLPARRASAVDPMESLSVE